VTEIAAGPPSVPGNAPRSDARVGAAAVPGLGTLGRKLKGPALMIAPWIAALVAWHLVAVSGLISSALVPTPGQVFKQFWRLLTTQRLWFDMLVSSQRVLLGLAAGITLAVPIGFVLGWYRPVRMAVDPLVNFFRALPPISLIPLVIVYFGIGETAKIVMLFYAAFFTGVIVMYEGIVQINPLFIRVAPTLGATDGEVFRRVIIPLTVPHVLTAVRVALGVAWATLVASELIAAQRGLGAVIQNASNYFQIDVIYAGIICIGVIALLMDRCLRALGARLVRWQERIVP
jgi:NitT/TauT family transport system permease protein